MNRKQGPRDAGMRPAVNAASDRLAAPNAGKTVEEGAA
jgi:hypothetical protein